MLNKSIKILRTKVHEDLASLEKDRNGSLYISGFDVSFEVSAKNGLESKDFYVELYGNDEEIRWAYEFGCDDCQGKELKEFLDDDSHSIEYIEEQATILRDNLEESLIILHYQEAEKHQSD